MFMAGETLKIFLLTGISKRTFLFMKKKKNVFVYNNIHDKFASTKLRYKHKNLIK